MKGNHLLLEKQRKYARTTNSNHTFFKYPNLIQNLILAEVNLIFVSDITRIKIKDGFAYFFFDNGFIFKKDCWIQVSRFS
ncbi:hypothetical protein LEP1GSC040_1510 [Leptospira santarosai str. 2000030832]|nr:hypothetical protein LEP1GSC040_1510 [Leptospira santarosai str. 2000030832]